MRRWSVFVILAVAAVTLLVAGELLADEPPVERETVIRLATHTPTVTRTAGWWTEVATWTPTATGAAAGATETPVIDSTPTPQLDLPPVRTLEPPTPKPTWTRRP